MSGHVAGLGLYMNRLINRNNELLLNNKQANEQEWMYFLFINEDLRQSELVQSLKKKERFICSFVK